MHDIITKLKTEHVDLTAQLHDPDVTKDPQVLATLSKKLAEIAPTIAKIAEYEAITKAMQDNAEMINGDDAEMTELATAENITLAEKLPLVEKELELLLLPKDPHDTKDVIIEIRAGAGGDESALFAGDLFRMYSRFAENNNWKVVLISTHGTGTGGFKEVIFELSAPAGTEPVYKNMKYESGVHRVQRIPETEKQGRVHTSTATVAVLPQAEEVDVVINAADLRIDTFASSGPGGQSVNTTMSAVRITHLPTNTVVSCQDEKSQHKNKDKAMKVLRSRLLQDEIDRQQKKLGDARNAQIGTGDRSEKIRTYNFPQDRITDHRIKQNWSNISGVLDGALAPIITALHEEDIAKKLAAR